MHPRQQQKLTSNTPIQHLYLFLRRNKDLIGGCFSRDMFEESLTVNVNDRIWVFEKLIEYGILKKSGINAGTDNPLYYVDHGAMAVFRWVFEMRDNYDDNSNNNNNESTASNKDDFTHDRIGEPQDFAQEYQTPEDIYLESDNE